MWNGMYLGAEHKPCSNLTSMDLLGFLSEQQKTVAESAHAVQLDMQVGLAALPRSFPSSFSHSIRPQSQFFCLFFLQSLKFNFLERERDAARSNPKFKLFQIWEMDQEFATFLDFSAEINMSSRKYLEIPNSQPCVFLLNRDRDFIITFRHSDVWPVD